MNWVHVGIRKYHKIVTLSAPISCDLYSLSYLGILIFLLKLYQLTHDRIRNNAMFNEMNLLLPFLIK